LYNRFMAGIPDDSLRELTPHLNAAFDSLTKSASAGDVVAQREMISTCRDYLLFIANQELDAGIRPKCAPSDIVQNTMVRAVEKYDDFRGQNQRALLAWLRRILLNELHDARRHYIQADKRDIRREKSMDGDTSAAEFRPVLAAGDLTPSSDAAAREEAAKLRQALLGLSQEYQEVLRLRTWERLRFADVASQMDRSEVAVKKLWGRAVAALKQRLHEPTNDDPADNE
jgi:RNA polymerase sigma-70 factor (ECF subfamily)